VYFATVALTRRVGCYYSRPRVTCISKAFTKKKSIISNIVYAGMRNVAQLHANHMYELGRHFFSVVYEMCSCHVLWLSNQ
jgi:hypothetical protein